MPTTQCQCQACRANRGESSIYNYMCEAQGNSFSLNIQQVSQITTIPSNILTNEYARQFTQQFIPEPMPEKPDTVMKRVNGVNIIKMKLMYKIQK